MAEFLFSTRFTNKGPTNKNVGSLGGVSFTRSNGLYTNNIGRSAFFEPESDKAGLEIVGSSLSAITNHLSKPRCELGLYLRYKIKKKDLYASDKYASIPIISYIDPNTSKAVDLLSIDNKDHFTLTINGVNLAGDKLLSAFESKLEDVYPTEFEQSTKLEDHRWYSKRISIL